MTTSTPNKRRLIGGVLVALAIAACATRSGAQTIVPRGRPPLALRGAPPLAQRAEASRAKANRVDRLARIARARYGEEAYGTAVHVELRRVAYDGGLRAALSTGSQARLAAYVRSRFLSVWYHQHASRLRIVRAGRTLVDVGVPFAVRPASIALRDSRSRPAGRLDLSIQDIVGYIAFMRRNVHVDIVVRGQGTQHVRSSIPAAAHAPLPSQGITVVAGRRYAVRSFSQYAYPAEPITIWVLVRV